MIRELSFKQIISQLKLAGHAIEIFSDIHKTGQIGCIKGLWSMMGTHRDCIIGIGGGAALDVARAIVLQINHREDLLHTTT